MKTKRFLQDVWYELKRSIPRTVYFIRNGHLHPEVDPLGAKLREAHAALREVIER
jgi:hypothetical protein